MTLLVNYLLVVFFKKGCNRCVYTKEPVVMLNMSPYYEEAFVETTGDKKSTERLLNQ